MGSSHRRPSLVSRLLPLAMLFAGACAVPAGPVLPPAGNANPGGSLGGKATVDAAVGADVAEVDAASGAADTASDADTVACDLLKQDCPGKKQACYPESGAGMCETAGFIGEPGNCLAPHDCAQGLTCVSNTQFGIMGSCLPLCDVSNPVPSCGKDNPCHPLDGFTEVGYCQLG